MASQVHQLVGCVFIQPGLLSQQLTHLLQTDDTSEDTSTQEDRISTDGAFLDTIRATSPFHQCQQSHQLQSGLTGKADNPNLPEERKQLKSVTSLEMVFAPVNIGLPREPVE